MYCNGNCWNSLCILHVCVFQISLLFPIGLNENLQFTFYKSSLFTNWTYVGMSISSLKTYLIKPGGLVSILNKRMPEIPLK